MRRLPLDVPGPHTVVIAYDNDKVEVTKDTVLVAVFKEKVNVGFTYAQGEAAARVFAEALQAPTEGDRSRCTFCGGNLTYTGGQWEDEFAATECGTGDDRTDHDPERKGN